MDKQQFIVKGALVGKLNKHRIIGLVKIYTTKEGLEKIKKEPLQPFGEFEIVTYCLLGVYQNNKLIDTIIAGNYDLSTYEGDLLLKMAQNNEYTEITF